MCGDLTSYTGMKNENWIWREREVYLVQEVVRWHDEKDLVTRPLIKGPVSMKKRETILLATGFNPSSVDLPSVAITNHEHVLANMNCESSVCG